ncbi:hypothetical protein M409DRAFT_63416 [Zasmidium cellare ATCC 36951]|uniref:Mitotic checkpoint regulator, MAD2B-interacting-domain-containing protein n=1 Tax=Zasmidium cellare ATCC 36951 TaxID=1080233 RepID=A0A6A6CXV3_ZASCE|nr:uncharacterized protein M409DRAFT_63416 [Zasmidium cellare ATCC 36951]KAF2171865.1 hypothetical protein M409DRAFT_63416 [Zasmidium cellare ATCC 36951]
MALVDYSDSESETESRAEAPKQTAAAKPAFQKAAPGKIAVSLPSLKPEPGQKKDESADGPPAKRARTGGAFSGINSFLPAPKKSGANAPKPGISLKTSSEAAFSRNPPPQAPIEEDVSMSSGNGENSLPEKTESAEEPKLVRKNTRFLPLSVSSKKKKKPANKPPPVTERTESASNGKHSDMARAAATNVAKEKDPEPAPKPKRSLFAMNQEEQALPVSSSTGDYKPLIAEEGRGYLPEEVQQTANTQSPANPASSNPNSLEAVAADMNLTPAQRRQLFGRHGGKDFNVAHFNLDSEYAANEQMRQAGEVIEHRAVKAVAPGKHSLQQLVNNARTQQEALEDKWGEGRRARGEGGSKYGWSG